jgi:hypothetical protein
VEFLLRLASRPRRFPAPSNKITQYMIFLIGNESVSPEKLSPWKFNALQFSNREEFSFFHSPILPLPMEFCSPSIPSHFCLTHSAARIISSPKSGRPACAARQGKSERGAS